LKESGSGPIDLLFRHLFGGTEKTTQNLRQDSRCYSQDSNRATPEYEPKNITTTPPRPMLFQWCVGVGNTPKEERRVLLTTEDTGYMHFRSFSIITCNPEVEMHELAVYFTSLHQPNINCNSRQASAEKYERTMSLVPLQS
jgi:hypothetical protein